MGLLDDAIREHLELKRLHGADPSEVSRLEQEAFGPVQRGEALEPTGSAPADPPDSPAPPDPADSEPAPPAAEVPDDLTEEHAPAAAEAPASDPTGSQAGPDVLADEDERAFEATLDPGPRASGAVPAEDPQETRAFSLDELEEAERPVPSADPPAGPEPPAGPPPEHVAPDPEPVAVDGEHDELEETPDFLQETPEHDRLWFEQKPPKDFDF